MATANLLAVFDILPALDPVTNKEVFPPIEYLFGFTRLVCHQCFLEGRVVTYLAYSKPVDFKVRIIPRSEKHAMLVRQECQ